MYWKSLDVKHSHNIFLGKQNVSSIFFKQEHFLSFSFPFFLKIIFDKNEILDERLYFKL